MKKQINISMAVVLGATLLLSGCGGSSSGSGAQDGSVANLKVEGKVFHFYNVASGEQYLVDTDAKSVTSLNSDATSNLYRVAKEAGQLFYWPWIVDNALSAEKTVMLRAEYDYARDGNLTYEDIYYLGDLLASPPHAHAGSEFNDPSKEPVLQNLNSYLAHQQEIQEEIKEALALESKQLCSFFVPAHAHEEEEHGAAHYAITTDAKVYIFEEGEEGLEKDAGPIALTGATSCLAQESGITTSGEHGVYVFLKETQSLYLVDAHELPEGGMTIPHQHSVWELKSFMPAGFSASQMIGYGAGDSGHEH